VGGRAFSVGTVPIKGIQSDGRAATVAAVVAVLPLDRSYLDTRTADDRSLSIELVDDDIVLARFGDQPSTAAIRPLVGSAISEDRATTSTLGDRFVDVQPVHDAAGKPVFALVVSRPTGAVSSSRTSLWRTLFDIALGGSPRAERRPPATGRRTSSPPWPPTTAPPSGPGCTGPRRPGGARRARSRRPRVTGCRWP